ncbi:MAG: ABC transporter permease [Rhodospirillaceae bacterium]|nr:ABC transporter permease [Rhodospirillales bacterium]
MNPLTAVALKEFRAGVRNRWVVAATLVLAGLAIGLAFMGSAPTGTVGASRLAVTVVSLASLTIFLVPLIALLLSFDTLVGEIEAGTMLLLLSYPVSRGQVVWGKFLGQSALLAVATSLGYGAAGLGIALAVEDRAGFGDWPAFAMLIVTSIMLGACFLALGVLASALVRERATAAGVAVGMWLVFVLLFDLGLLGLLAATEGRGISAELFRWVLLLNPADAFRLLNLTSFSDIRQFAGMAGLTEQASLPPLVLAAALAFWVVAPLVTAHALFARRSL